VVYALAVGDGLGGIWTTGWGVFVFSFALALVVVFVVGAAEDGAAAGVDACCGEDGSGFGGRLVRLGGLWRVCRGWDLRNSLASLRASLELLKLEPVTMSLVHPTSCALFTTPLRSSGCLDLPW